MIITTYSRYKSGPTKINIRALQFGLKFSKIIHQCVYLGSVSDRIYRYISTILNSSLL
jgi:hypothetical protein